GLSPQKAFSRTSETKKPKKTELERWHNVGQPFRRVQTCATTQRMQAETIQIAAQKNHLEELLTVEELASVLKVSKNWVYQRIHTRNLPVPMLKVGHYPRFPVSGVREFIESQTKPGNSA